MPVVINEVEVLPEQATAPAAAGGPAAPRPAEPAYEQLRRLLRDLAGRELRRRAD